MRQRIAGSLVASLCLSMSALLVFTTPAQALSTVQHPVNVAILNGDMALATQLGTVPAAGVQGAATAGSVATTMSGPTTAAASSSGYAAWATGALNGAVGIGSGAVAFVAGLAGLSIDFGREAIHPYDPVNGEGVMPGYDTDLENVWRLEPDPAYPNNPNVKRRHYQFAVANNCTEEGDPYGVTPCHLYVSNPGPRAAYWFLDVLDSGVPTTPYYSFPMYNSQLVTGAGWLKGYYRCRTDLPAANWGSPTIGPPCSGRIRARASGVSLSNEYKAGPWLRKAVNVPPLGTRTIEQTITCKKNNGNTYKKVQNTEVKDTETGVIELAGMMCDEGDLLESADTNLAQQGKDDVVPLVPHIAAPPWVADEYQGLCRSQGSDACKLELQYKSSTGAWLSCHYDPTPCLDWRTSTAYPEGFRCQWIGLATGPVTKPLGRCEIYVDIGKPNDSPRPTPCNQIPGAVCTAPPPAPPPEGSTDCGFNLGDILTGAVVYKAFTCALKWAFVPPANTWQGLMGRLGDAWESTAPYTALGVIGDLTTPWLDIDTDGGCQGPEVHIPPAGFNHARPFSTCNEPAAGIIAIWIPVVSVVLVTGTVALSARMLVSTIWPSSPPPGGGAL